MHQLILRGWRPPKQMPPKGLGTLVESIEDIEKWDRTLKLTAHELRVLQLMSDGYTAQQIADILQVGLETSKSATKAVRRKLGARNTPHAIAMAMREGIIE